MRRTSPRAHPLCAARQSTELLGLLGAEIVQTDIKASVESIMAPAIPIALRLSGHLLLGVCRIYSRKVVYLYNESNEAMVKTKMVSASARHAAPAGLPLPSARVG